MAVVLSMAVLTKVLSLMLELLEALPPHAARRGSKEVAAGGGNQVAAGEQLQGLQGHYGPTYSQQALLTTGRVDGGKIDLTVDGRRGAAVHEGQQLGSLANLTTLGAAALGCIACLDLRVEAIEATAHFGAAADAEAPEATAEY